MTCQPSMARVSVSVLPSQIDLALVKDADTTFEFGLLDADSNPVDITADTVELNVYDYTGGTSKLVKSNGPGSHYDAANGKTRFTIARTDIADTLEDETTAWVYEVRRVQAAGAESVHLQGSFAVRLSVAGG